MPKRISKLPPDYRKLGNLGGNDIMVRIVIAIPTIHIGHNNSRLGQSHKILPKLSSRIEITNPEMLATIIARTQQNDISGWKIRINETRKTEVLQKLIDLEYEGKIKFPK